MTQASHGLLQTGAETRHAADAAYEDLSLRGYNQIRVEQHTNLAAEQIQQNGDPVTVRYSVKEAGIVHECACEHAYLIARHK